MSHLLTASDVRALAQSLHLHPSKRLGQNFVIDGNTVRRIVALSGVAESDVVLEVGPGLGSLTLGMLPQVAGVVAVEVDPGLAAALPLTVQQRLPRRADRLQVVTDDALRVPSAALRLSASGAVPTALVANLPYNVAVPVLLRLLADVPSLRTGMVMVQKEVGLRLAAGPGSRTYGVPSAKLAWFATAQIAGPVPRSVFWPEPNVDSVLVRLRRREPPPGAQRAAVFAVVDAAFSQRRKMLRSSLAAWAGSAADAEKVLRAAGVDPSARGEALSLPQFVAISAAAAR